MSTENEIKNDADAVNDSIALKSDVIKDSVVVKENDAIGKLPLNANITYENILKYRFPLKLYLLANLEDALSVIWNDDGTAILLDVDALQDYLLSEQSLFRMKTREVFINHLCDHGFQFVDKIILSDITHDIYKHEFFKRGKAVLLPKIIYKRFNVESKYITQNSSEKCESEIDQKSHLELDESGDDPCKKKLFYLTDETKSFVSINAYGAYNRDKTAIEFAIQTVRMELKSQGLEKRRRRSIAASNTKSEPIFPEGLRVDPATCDSRLINRSTKGIQGFFGETVNENALKTFFEDSKYNNSQKTIGELMKIGDDESL